MINIKTDFGYTPINASQLGKKNYRALQYPWDIAKALPSFANAHEGTEPSKE
jgi:hypothetical protein